MVLSEATHIDIKEKAQTWHRHVDSRQDEPTGRGKETDLTPPCWPSCWSGRPACWQSTRRRLSREADADFLSVYHLIGPINRPETFHDTIKASFELHCGIWRDKTWYIWYKSWHADPAGLPVFASARAVLTVSVVWFADGRFSRVHIIYQIGLKLDHKDPSVMF